ncbi:MAG TPA: purine-nucleoside phosphorylase [Candidatus Cybelea sp.]|nr:purine-nucleoside phosphorylase [Candidatus Cybelea sp.]
MIEQLLEGIPQQARGFRAQIGLILGSGLGPFADMIDRSMVVSYSDLPGFPRSGVVGHAGKLILGWIGRTPVAALQGRAHYYEHGDPAAMKGPIDTLAALGCGAVIVTNAGGSLTPDIPAGSVAMITDHISLTQRSPLFGEAGSKRFIDMVDAYDPVMRIEFASVARRIGLDLKQGVYVWFSGPQFETPAEVRAARVLGGDIAGMSTVPDVILARYAGLKVAGFSIVTNLGAGLGDEKLSHEHTMVKARAAADKLFELLQTYISEYGG